MPDPASPVVTETNPTTPVVPPPEPAPKKLVVVGDKAAYEVTEVEKERLASIGARALEHGYDPITLEKAVQDLKEEIKIVPKDEKDALRLELNELKAEQKLLREERVQEKKALEDREKGMAFLNRIKTGVEKTDVGKEFSELLENAVIGKVAALGPRADVETIISEEATKLKKLLGPRIDVSKKEEIKQKTAGGIVSGTGTGVDTEKPLDRHSIKNGKLIERVAGRVKDWIKAD